MTPGAPNRLTIEHRARRDHEWAMRAGTATEMWLQGKRQKEIAAALGLSVPLVSRLLKRWREIVNRRAAGATEKWIARELARLDWMWKESCEAWQKSKRPKQKTRIREGGKDGDILEEVEEGQCGDPRIMAELLKIHHRICELLGLDAPKKVDATIQPVAPAMMMPREGEDVAAMDGSILPPALMYSKIVQQALLPPANGNGHNGNGHGHATNTLPEGGT